MPDLWYYGKNGQRHGPVPLTELKALVSSGSLHASDLVWSPGMADWTAASEVDGLLSEPASMVAPPPPPPPEATSPPPPSPATEAPAAQDRWHYEQQGERCAPVSLDELRNLAASGQIQPENLVWKRGMVEWTPARYIDGLFPIRPEPAAEPGDRWYYRDGEQRHGAIPFGELQHLAASGQVQPSDLVWSYGLADWTAAADVEGLFPGDDSIAIGSELRESPTSLESAEVPSSSPVPKPSLQERLQKFRDAAAPHLSRAGRAIRTNWERFRKFIHRQHLGTRLRLLVAATARSAIRCYNAARPHVVRAWERRPSRREVRDWSAARAQKVSEAWKRTAPQRTRLAQWMSVGLREAREGLGWCWKNLREFLAWSWRKTPSRKDVRSWLASGSRQTSAFRKRTAAWGNRAAAWSWQRVRNLGTAFVRPLRSRKSASKPEPKFLAPQVTASTFKTKSLPPDVAAARPKRKPLPPDVAAAAPKWKPLPPDVAAAAPKPGSSPAAPEADPVTSTVLALDTLPVTTPTDAPLPELESPASIPGPRPASSPADQERIEP